MTFRLPGVLRVLPLLALSFWVGACATHSNTKKTAARAPGSGDFVDEQLAADTYTIRYAGHGRHPKGYVEDQMMLRAAELTLEHGYTYFALVGVGPELATTESTTASTRSTSSPAKVTAASFGLYGSGLSAFGSRPMTVVSQPDFSGGSVRRKTPTLTIRLFHEAPSDLIASNAANIEKAIKKKYELDRTAQTAQL